MRRTFIIAFLSSSVIAGVAHGQTYAERVARMAAQAAQKAQQDQANETAYNSLLKDPAITVANGGFITCSTIADLLTAKGMDQHPALLGDKPLTSYPPATLDMIVEAFDKCDQQAGALAKANPAKYASFNSKFVIAEQVARNLKATYQADLAAPPATKGAPQQTASAATPTPDPSHAPSTDPSSPYFDRKLWMEEQQRKGDEAMAQSRVQNAANDKARLDAAAAREKTIAITFSPSNEPSKQCVELVRKLWVEGEWARDLSALKLMSAENPERKNGVPILQVNGTADDAFTGKKQSISAICGFLGAVAINAVIREN